MQAALLTASLHRKTLCCVLPETNDTGANVPMDFVGGRHVSARWYTASAPRREPADYTLLKLSSRMIGWVPGRRLKITLIVPRIAEGCRIPVTNARPSSFFVLNVDARIYSAKVDASPARSVDCEKGQRGMFSVKILFPHRPLIDTHHRKPSERVCS